MPCIDADVATFLHSGTTCIVACSSETGVPDLSMALACWPGEGDVLEVALDEGESSALRRRLAQEGARVAVVACRPTDLVTLQLKGGEVSFAPLDAASRASLQTALSGIKTAFERIGLSPAYVSTLMQSGTGEIVRLRIRVDEVFNQTPGPGAGQRRGAA